MKTTDTAQTTLSTATLNGLTISCMLSNGETTWFVQDDTDLVLASGTQKECQAEFNRQLRIAR